MSDHEAGLVEDAPVAGHDGQAPAVRLLAVAQGRADLRAGRLISPEEIDDWIETVGTPFARPVPQFTFL